MKKRGSKKYKCPLCFSILIKSHFNKVKKEWTEIKNKLKDYERQTKITKQQEKNLKKVFKEKEKKIRETERKNVYKTISRKDRAIEEKDRAIEELKKQTKKLKEQLKKGITPQIGGLKFQEEMCQKLKDAFPKDSIEFCKETGDIIQKIKGKKGVIATILYECKQTQIFLGTYIEQIKRDKQKRNADVGIIISTAMKKGITGFWSEGDIHIVHPSGAIFLADLIRTSLIEIDALKIPKKEKERKADLLFNYIQSKHFKELINDGIYRTKNLCELLAKEYNDHKKIWKNRLKNYIKINKDINLLKEDTISILKEGKLERKKKEKLNLLPHKIKEIEVKE